MDWNGLILFPKLLSSFLIFQSRPSAVLLTYFILCLLRLLFFFYMFTQVLFFIQVICILRLYVYLDYFSFIWLLSSFIWIYSGFCLWDFVVSFTFGFNCSFENVTFYLLFTLFLLQGLVNSSCVVLYLEKLFNFHWHISWHFLSFCKGVI